MRADAAPIDSKTGTDTLNLIPLNPTASHVSLSDIEVAGKTTQLIPVSISSRFLEHFSEQLYSSPNKAFEELLANAWDANARSTYVYLPLNPQSDDAAIYVLDDGTSMNAAGLEDLWKVAYSKKTQEQVTQSGRAVIGKFGIGKLATYVLADKLSYVCKAADGIIRAVTMDYSTLDSDQQTLIANTNLDLRVISKDELQKILDSTADGKKIFNLISHGIPQPKAVRDWDDEFGGQPCEVPQSTGSWTLVLLTSLKKRGKDVKTGIVRRMLQTSLPLGAELNIILNDELLISTKSDLTLIGDWQIGPELGISEILLPPREGAEGEEQTETITISSSFSPYPYTEINGVGRLTGRIRLFADRISGGKSDEHGASNGFFVNVRGRVTNTNPHFGLKDLSHSAWARFRMTVRADGLNSLLAVNREQFTEQRELRVFRAFLRAAFNKARSKWEEHDNWGDTGAAIVKSYGMLPLLSFRNFIDQTISDEHSAISDLIDLGGVIDVDDAQNDYRAQTQHDLREVLKGVDFSDKGASAGLASYSLKNRSVSINSGHPFVAQHMEDKGQKQAIKDVMLVELLTDVHALDIGIDSSQLAEMRRARDRIARSVAKIHRRSGAQIATMLMEVSTHPNFRALEIIVGDALEYLGLQVTRIGGSGEPEGIARAKLPPSKSGESQAYSFSYDAKSSINGKAQTGNCNIAGLTRHRDNHDVDFILLVAPDFQAGALDQECDNYGVTPIRAKDLGRLLIMSAEHGAIPLTKLREIFDNTSPDNVTTWINGLSSWLQAQRVLDLSDLITTLESLETTFPDVVSVAVLADRCRQLSKKHAITENDLRRLLAGLQIIVPELIQTESDRVVITVHPHKLAEAINKQLQRAKAKENEA